MESIILFNELVFAIKCNKKRDQASVHKYQEKDCQKILKARLFGALGSALRVS